MPRSIHFRIGEDPDGAWRLTLGDRDTRPATGHLSASAVEGVVEMAAALDVMPAVVVPGNDARRTALEEKVGLALGSLVAAVPAVAARLAYQLGLAESDGTRPALVIDAEGAPEQLPWELLAVDGTPLEAAHRAVVARLGDGRPPLERDLPPRLRVLRWMPAEDDACRKVADHTARLLEGRADLIEVDGSLDEIPTEIDVLHLVCHGRRLHDGQLVVLGRGEQAPGTVSHQLGDLLPRLGLVVLDVCHGGDETAAQIASLTARLVQGGAPACVSPVGKCAVEATEAFASGLYPVLASGGALIDAVAAGRQRVAGLSIAHPDGRWSNHRLHLGDLQTPTRPGLVRPRWKPASWPEPATDASDFVDVAAQIAARDGAGYVGVEHLALALAEHGGGGPVTAHARYTLAGFRWASGLTVESPANRLVATPRLTAWGASLPDGFELDALWRLICADADHLLRLEAGIALARVPGQATSDDDTLPEQEFTAEELADMLAPPSRLQVVGGPEDGWTFTPTPGDVVGRWHPESPAAWQLYRDQAVIDRRLSRAHLEWLGPGQVRLIRRTAVVTRQEIREDLEGTRQIRSGDVLVLTQNTRLRAGK